MTSLTVDSLAFAVGPLYRDPACCSHGVPKSRTRRVAEQQMSPSSKGKLQQFPSVCANRIEGYFKLEGITGVPAM